MLQIRLYLNSFPYLEGQAVFVVMNLTVGGYVFLIGAFKGVSPIVLVGSHDDGNEDGDWNEINTYARPVLTRLQSLHTIIILTCEPSLSHYRRNDKRKYQHIQRNQQWPYMSFHQR